MFTSFSEPAAHFLNADSKTVGEIVASACDVALVIDQDGVIKDIAGERDSISRLRAKDWSGRRLEDVVGPASRAKISQIINGSTPNDSDVSYVVDHPVADDESIHVRYCAITSGTRHGTVLLGRDFSAGRALQNRLLDSQQSIEHRFERQRQDEARYRMLFQIASDAIVVVDAASGKIMEANQASVEFLGSEVRGTNGRRFSALFGKSDRAAIEDLLSKVQNSGSPSTVRASLNHSSKPVLVRVTLCRTGETSTFLIQLENTERTDQAVAPDQNLLALIRVANEAIVLTDDSGFILWGNQSFIDLTQSGAIDRIMDRFLGDYFDSAELDVGITLANVLRHERLRMLPATLRGISGQITHVELSIVKLAHSFPPGFGIVARNVMSRPTDRGRQAQQWPHPGEAIEDLVGKVPLKELVRYEIDVLEKKCITAALKITGNNRAAAAKVLGLSRQGLYTKMHRYSLTTGDE